MKGWLSLTERLAHSIREKVASFGRNIHRNGGISEYCLSTDPLQPILDPVRPQIDPARSQLIHLKQANDETTRT